MTPTMNQEATGMPHNREVNASTTTLNKMENGTRMVDNLA